MALSPAFRIAGRELRGGLRGFGIFLACLALGVAAIAGIGSVRAGIEAGLARDGAALLGGDAEIELTYRFATPKERAFMEAQSTALSEIVDFRSMAVAGAGDDESRALTQIKAVDNAWPLLGKVELDPPMALSDALATKDLPGAVMDRVLIDRLGLKIGDSFALGSQRFRLSAALKVEPDNATGGFSLGPRTLVLTQDLKKAGLLAPGTLYSTHYRMLLPEGTDPETVKQLAQKELAQSGMRWRDARNGAPRVREFVERLGAFLILVGLSGLAVGGVGVSASVRAYLAGKTETIATLRTMGATGGTLFTAYGLQIAVLSGIGILIGLMLGGGIPVLLAPMLQSSLPVPAVFSLYPKPLIEAALYGALTAALFTLWPLARTETVRGAALFRASLEGARALPHLPYILGTLGLLAALIGTAAWFSGSLMLTLWTAGGIALALLALALSAMALKALSRRTARAARTRPGLRWALAAIGGPQSDAVPVVLALGLGLSVLAAVGQIDGTLRGAITRELPNSAPSYFIVDIQKDQMPGFLEKLKNDKAVNRVDHAPMLRGVISRINDRPARDVAGDHWVVTGDRGITYADAKPDNTRVVAGKWWPEGYTGPAQVSFSAEEAAEMGLKLGDMITMNVLGRDITATLTSFREVDFSNAGMGFVLTLSPQPVASAPHGFIATIYADLDAEARILRDLARAYPNITAIRVRDAIDRVADLLGSIASATSWGAAVTLLTGFLVLIGASASGGDARAREAAILKTLGASRRRILISFLMRAILLGAAAGAVALAAGMGAGWAVSRFVFDTDYTVIWGSGLAVIAGGIIANLLASVGFSLSALGAPPGPNPARTGIGRPYPRLNTAAGAGTPAPEIKHR